MKQYLGALAALAVLVLVLMALGLVEGLQRWTVESCARQGPAVAGSGVRSMAMITVPFLALCLLAQVTYQCGVELCRRTTAE